jgi:hypothetical protein
MDLYGSGASIAQANSQSETARQLNQATADFNNSLAEQLDQANLAVDEDQAGKMQKNLVSLSTSGGKVVSKLEVGKNAKKALGGFKEIKTSLAERMAREVGEERAPLLGGVEGGEQFGARQALRAAEDRTGTAGVFAGEDLFSAAQEEAARFGGEVTDIGGGAPARAPTIDARLGTGPETSATAIGGDPRFGLDDTVEEAVSRRTGVPTQETLEAAHGGPPSELYTAEQTVDESTQAAEAARTAEGGIETTATAAGKTSLEVGADVAKGVLKTGGKTVLAGVGGAIDVYQDIDRIAKGGLNKDAFGSNNWSRVGNVLNVVGSGLEVAGVLTAWTGIGGLSLEAAGAGLALAGSGLETYGDIEATDDTKEKTDVDITSQRRGEVAAAQVETATGRTQ